MVTRSAPIVLDEEPAAEADSTEKFHQLVARLSRQSVDKHYDAYADIDWESEDNRIDPADPRWALPAIDPLGGTDWYRSLPAETRARLGLWRVVAAMKIGVQFENILKRGLLLYAIGLPNGAPEFRYAYHETVEESHHGMMFQEFVNRSGLPVRGLPLWMRDGASLVAILGRLFPELFFFFVLGGEDPIDHVQRQTLSGRTGTGPEELHPLLVTVMRHHVTEEARHLSFARHWLKLRVPTLGAPRKVALSLAVPVILGAMARIMLAPSPAMIREFNIPAEVVRAAYRDNPDSRAEARRSLRKVRTLAEDLGLVTGLSRPLWRALGIWEEAG